MTKAITLYLPDPIFEKAQVLASMQNLALHDYLLTTIALPEIALDPLTDAVAEAEERAFRELHPQLVQHYPGQYVAVAGGRVVDRDADQVTLYRRARLAYPAQFVLIAQVQPAPEEVFVFRSPRILREQTSGPSKASVSSVIATTMNSSSGAMSSIS